MSAQNLSRKRTAPGAEPVGYPQSMQQSAASYNAALGPQLSNDEFLQWGQASSQQPNTFQDPSAYNVAPPSYPSTNLPVSNQIARRPINQVVTRPPVNVNNAQWMADPNPATGATTNSGWEDDVEDLEEKAQVAKRESAAKRKQIPPFVLKLRSFVEDPKNADLIRWTDDGRSFVVLDEDEFAKKLIPELFKHNNYASFVRQLNMYGFHKKVGLSDNSMRASERKAKSPSEYSNPYFRRGYPDLMWLIQKPKNVTTSSKGKGRNKTEGDNIDEGEEVQEEISNNIRARPRPQLTLGDGSANTLPKATAENVQRELQLIRRQQAQISQMMASIKREHEQLYGQAITFQDQHTRHENSINAILTFLATIYQRSLSGNETAQGLPGTVFPNPLPQDSNKSGTVVDVGDYNFDQYPMMDDTSNKLFKKPQLLLTDGQNRATTMSPGSTDSPMMRSSRQSSHKPPNSPQIQELFDGGIDDANSSAFNQNFRAHGRQGSQQDMMSVIENTNARNPSVRTPVADFTHALNKLEHSQGNSPLSNAQRQDMLRMINSRANQSGDNALINSNPPSGPVNFDRRLASTKADLDALARMQAQQNESVEKLTNLLQPLSPSGSIPGINDGQQLPPAPVDIDDIFGANGNPDHDDYFNDLRSDGNGNIDFTHYNNADAFNNWDPTGADEDELFANVDNNDGSFDFGLKDEYDDTNNFLTVGDHDGGGRVESVASSEVTTPKTSSGGLDDETFSVNRGKGRKLSTVEEESTKRRRKS